LLAASGPLIGWQIRAGGAGNMAVFNLLYPQQPSQPERGAGRATSGTEGNETEPNWAEQGERWAKTKLG